MVEEVVSIEAELSLDAFGDREGLADCHVVEEGIRSAIEIEADVADLTARGQSERTRKSDEQFGTGRRVR